MEWIDIVAKEHEWLNDYGQASESDKIAHRLRKPAATVRRINRAGLDVIAAGLRRDDVAIF